MLLDELAVKVPFIVRWPGAAPRGMLAERLVSSIDILPAILDAAGLAAPEPVPGLSLRPLVFGTDADWRTRLFCEWNTSHPYPLPSLLYPQRTVRDGRYKLVRTLLPDRDDPVEAYYTQQMRVQTGASQAGVRVGVRGLSLLVTGAADRLPGAYSGKADFCRQDRTACRSGSSTVRFRSRGGAGSRHASGRVAVAPAARRGRGPRLGSDPAPPLS